MKNPNKVVVGIVDQGVFSWWYDENSDLAKLYHQYYDRFEMENVDFTANKNTGNEKKVCGSHGYWVLDRLLQVCGNANKIKIINCKIFQSDGKSSSESLCNALAYLVSQEVDLVNMSIGIPRNARLERGFVDNVNLWLDRIVNEANGLSIVSAGNEGEILSNGEIVENSNLFTTDPDNNLSVGSHNASGQWDTFSSVGGCVDVSTVGSNLNLLGERKMSTVSGTSFSAPTFTGICANYLIDQFETTRKGKPVKEVIYEHLDEAIKPVYKGDNIWSKLKTAIVDGRYSASPWYGRGSFESYARYFIKHYGRDVEQYKLFNNNEIRIM